ncbi:MAG: exopolyphosphatase [Desulfatibacillaceae bacterium]
MRVVTRLDLDGVGCAALLDELGLMDDLVLTHPGEVQAGNLAVDDNDIIANLPYVPGCGMWFDHHASEGERGAFGDFKGMCDTSAPSAARVIYEFFGGVSRFSNPRIPELVQAVDKADAARFTREEIMNPTRWVLLSFLADPRTGMEDDAGFDTPHERFMRGLVRQCLDMPVEDILKLPAARERADRYFAENRRFVNMIRERARILDNVVVLDLRDVRDVPTGNRHVVYALHPGQNVSVQVMQADFPGLVHIAVGHSILNRTSNTRVGSLMLEYGGGGHDRAGGCRVPEDSADRTVSEIVDRLIRDG